MNLTRAFAPLTDFYSDSRLILVLLLLSSLLGIAAIALGLSMIVIANVTILPWAVILTRKIHGDWARYGWLAIFELLVILQLAHFAEHVSQMVELHFLEWPTVRARGIVGELDIEPVHWWWNTAILAATTLLLFPFRRNAWLWASFLFSIWHEAEHVYVYFFWFLPSGISGHPGILGAGGLLDQADVYLPFLTELSRADLHFWYNFFEIGLFALAFVRQVVTTAHATRPPSWSIAPSTVRQRAWLALGFVQIPLILGVALLQHSPHTLRVPEDYPTIQSAIDAAPDGAVVRIGPGNYGEPIQIMKPLTLVGAPNGQTRLVGDDETPLLTIRHTHDVALKELTVDGGWYGILVEESQSVQILNNHVFNATFAGIRLSRAAANIVDNQVRSVRGPYGMGIELANTVSRPPSLIRQNFVADNVREGIVLHNARALIEKNVVMGNGLRGIAVTEMSMATVRANLVANNADAGIFVVDSSMAEIHANYISAVTPGPNGDADGIRAYFYAEVMLGRNEIDMDPEHAVVARQGATIEVRYTR